mgnify:CR=1 FL=1
MGIRGTNTRRATRIRLTAGVSLAVLVMATPLAVMANEQSSPNLPLEEAQADRSFTFAIASKPLPKAIAEFSSVTGLQVLYTETAVFDHTAPALTGTFTARDALKRLLAGSGLVGRYTSAASVTIEQPGGGESSKDVMTMGPVTVEGRQENASGAVSGYVARRSSSSTKTDTPLIETPQSISVITRDQMDARNVNKINEALRYTPGIDSQPYGNEPRYTDLRMRGLNATTNGMYQDGLALAFPDYVVSYNPEPWGAERVEVPRGPASVLYGQGSPGGLINYVSKRPTTDPIRFVEVEGGDFDRYQGKFDFAGAIDESKQFAYRLTGLHRDSDTFIDYIEDDRYWFAPQISWRPSDATTLTVFSHYQQDKTKNSQALPMSGTVTSNANGRVPIGRFVGEPDLDRVDRTEYSIGYEVSHDVGEMLKLNHKFRYNYVDLDDVVVYGSGFDGNRTLSRSVYANFGNLDGFFTDSNAQMKLDFAGTKHTLLAGLDYQLMYLEQISSSGTATSIDVFAPVYGTQTSEGNVFLNKDFTRSQTGFYLQDQIEWGDHWRVTLGGRFDRAVIETIDHRAGTTKQQASSAFTGRAGVVYLFDSGFAPYASYSESFTPVVGSDSAGNNFRPETGTQYEVGVKFQPKGSRSSVTVAAFDLRRQNYTETEPGTNLTVQTAGVRSQGIEIEATASFDFGLDVTGGYTYMETEIIESVDPADLGDPLTPAPKHVASVWADYTIQEGTFKGLGLGLGARYRGTHWGDANRTLSVPSFLLFDASLHYQWEGLKFGLHARNLLDKYHVGSCYYRNSAGICTAGEPLTVMANMSYQW